MDSVPQTTPKLPFTSKTVSINRLSVPPEADCESEVPSAAEPASTTVSTPMPEDNRRQTEPARVAPFKESKARALRLLCAYLNAYWRLAGSTRFLRVSILLDNEQSL